MEKLGIIAAKGDLSKKLMEYCQGRYEFFVAAIKGEVDLNLLQNYSYIELAIGEVGKAIDAFKKAGVKKIIFVGSLNKPDILKLKVDMVGAKLLALITKNKLFGDNNILTIIHKFFEEEGFEIIGVHEIIAELIVKAQNFTKLKPSQQEQDDIKMAIKILDQMSEFDIGQALVIENGVVLGIEAIEGTDELIKRAGKLRRIADERSGILVKRAKLGQNLKIDMPTIGVNTIKNLIKANLRGVVIQSEKTIFLDQEESIDLAEKNDLFIVCEN